MTITLDVLRQRLVRNVARRIHEPGTREAAVAVVLAAGGAGSAGTAGLHLLLIKRAEHPGDPWSGQMALPGGRRDPGDADLFDTVVRETGEEVGVELRREWLLGELDDLHPRTRTLPPVVVRPFVFGLPVRPVVRPSAEVASFVWASLEELASGATREEVEIAGLGRRFPAFRIGNDYVWGMTERILSPFFDLAQAP